MQIKPVRLAVLGYGHFIRTNFIKHLRNCDSIEIAAVYNRGEERRIQAAADGFEVTGDLGALLARQDIEAVLIGTANAAHRDEAIRAARAGKHILCEKPMALTLPDIDDMVREAETAGIVTHVNHPTPYGDDFILFRQLCDRHAGKILHLWRRNSRTFGLWCQGAHHEAVAHPEQSGGWTFHHLCHHLNAACVLLGSSHATRVYHLAQKSTPDAPSEELVNCLLTFDNGATASLSDGTPIGAADDMGVQGTEGDIRHIGNQIIVTRPGPEDTSGRPGQRQQLIDSYPVQPGGKNLVATGHRFAEAVRGRGNELLSFRFVRDQYRILQALQESAASGKAINIDW